MEILHEQIGISQELTQSYNLLRKWHLKCQLVIKLKIKKPNPSLIQELLYF